MSNRWAYRVENLAAWSGCVVSGHNIWDALKKGDYTQAIRYLRNQDIPALPTVGIGNVRLDTAARVWRKRACSAVDTGSNPRDCMFVQVGPMQTRNIFGWTVDIPNPFGSREVCTEVACAMTGKPSEIESYQILARQLLDNSTNIEYVAADLEIGALRAKAKGFPATAFNSASWHLQSLQTDDEFRGAGWPAGAAANIVADIPTALAVLKLTSSWRPEKEPQYLYWKGK